MTKLLEQALEAVRRMPPDAQDAIAKLLLDIADDEGEPEDIPPEHLPAVLEGLAEADRGEFLTDDQVLAIWAKHGL